MADFVAQRTKKKPDETLLLKSNWEARKKVEVRQLMDLTHSVHEKYGDPYAFYLILRQKDGLPVKIDYKNPVSSRWTNPDFAAHIIDDRSQKVEVIREIPNLDENYNYKQQKQYPSSSLVRASTKIHFKDYLKPETRVPEGHTAGSISDTSSDEDDQRRHLGESKSQTLLY